MKKTRSFRSNASLIVARLAHRVRFAGSLALLSSFVFASTGKAASVTLAWDQETGVAGYRVYYGAASGQYTNLVDAGPKTTNTVTGLAPGVTYFFAATAYNSIGVESGFSSEVSYTTGTTIASNNPPTLDPIGDVTLPEDAGAQTLTLTGIGSGSATEKQTLTVTATSSNPPLVPSPTVNYTSPNTSGALTFTPSANANGSATITVTVNDGQPQNNTISRTFIVTVQSINDPPSISSISDRTIAQDTSTGPIPFSVADLETAASNLQVTATSSNVVLVASNGLVLSGSDSARSITVTPAPGQSGNSRIVVSVSDGALTTSSGFNLAVTSAGSTSNSPPTISSIPDQAVARNQSTTAIPFTIADAQTPAAQLTLSASWSNPQIVSRVTFGGSGAARTVQVSPTRGKVGVSSITVTVSDGNVTASTTFQFKVS